MKIKYGTLKKLIESAVTCENKYFSTSQRLLGEQDEDEEAGAEEDSIEEPSPNVRKDAEQNDSIDAQIDRYIADYETEARNAKNEGFDLRALTLRLLSEQDTEAVGGQLDADTLDVESFTNAIVRLIDNYDALLEVRDVIVKRAINFLNRSYTPDVVEQFKDALLDQHDIELGKTEEDINAEKYQAPPADRAGGPGVAGGAGGAAGGV